MDRDTSMTRSPKSCQESIVIACRGHRQLIDVDRVMALPNAGRCPAALTGYGVPNTLKAGATIACRMLALFTRG